MRNHLPGVPGTPPGPLDAPVSVLSKHDLMKLAKQLSIRTAINQTWTDLGSYLGFTVGETNLMQGDCPAYIMLCEWSDRERERASLAVLKTAIQRLERRDLMDVFNSIVEAKVDLKVTFSGILTNPIEETLPNVAKLASVWEAVFPRFQHHGIHRDQVNIESNITVKWEDRVFKLHEQEYHLKLRVNLTEEMINETKQEETDASGWHPNLEPHNQIQLLDAMAPYIREDGHYLIRPHGNDKKAVSVTHNGVIRHYEVNSRVKDGELKYYFFLKGIRADTIEELIAYYKTHDLCEGVTEDNTPPPPDISEIRARRLTDIDIDMIDTDSDQRAPTPPQRPPLTRSTSHVRLKYPIISIINN